MKRKFRFILLLSLSLSIYGCGSILDDPFESALRDLIEWNSLELAQQGLSEPGSYIVGLNLQQSPKLLLQPSHAAEFSASFSLLYPLLGENQDIVDYQYIATIDHMVPENSLNPIAIDQLQFNDRLGWQSNTWKPEVLSLVRVDFKDEVKAREVLQRWAREGKIFFAEPNYLNHMSGLFQDSINAYSDQTFNNNWWLANISLKEAFTSLETREQTGNNSDLDLTSRPPVIAVMDSGVDYQHPQLADQMWQNEKPGASSCVNDIWGCNTTKATKGFLGTGDVHPFGTEGPGQPCPDDPNLARDCVHGTHVAGIVAAKPGSGIAGVCAVCKIMAIRVVKSGGGIPDVAILNAFKYITLFKRNNAGLVRVLNASIGKFQRSKAVGLMVRLLKGADRGILVIGAAGNEDTMTRAYPAAFSDVIAVSAVDGNGRKASYSNFGVWVDVAAPGGGGGVAINSTQPGNTNPHPSVGTSMAAPVVSGIAGLLLAQNPNIGFEELRARIVKSSNKSIYEADNEHAEFNRRNYFRKIKGDSIRRPMLGSGVVNAKAAVDGVDQGVELPALGKRVEPGCGTIGGRSSTGSQQDHTAGSLFFFVFFLSFPVLFGVFWRFRSYL